MPRLMTDPNDVQQGTIGGSSGFKFTGKRIEQLHALSTAWTLATLVVDETGSVLGFQDLLRSCLVTSIEGAKLSPQSDNIMVRVLFIGTQYDHGVEEIHGFKPLSEIDPADYPQINPRGWTTLNDGCYSAIGAMNEYGADLRKQDYNCNGIMIVITDGVENSSTATQAMVRQELESTVKDEKLESMVSILVGINAKEHIAALEAYQHETGINHYRDGGDITAESMAKLGKFIIQSLSSQSQHLGTGGPSQIPATI
jgi:hypothetical protein